MSGEKTLNKYIYKIPVLKRFGDVTELTQGGGGKKEDGKGGGFSKGK